jgi:nucleotide-binding universal stress UspA family protein
MLAHDGSAGPLPTEGTAVDAGPGRAEPPRLVVGSDDSEASAAAHRWARASGVAKGAELIVVRAQRLSRAPGWQEPWSSAQRALATSLVDVAAADAGYVLVGAASDALARFAVRLGATTVVIGADRPPPPQPWLGAVGSGLAAGGKVPFVVVPAGWERGLERVVLGDDGSAGAMAAARWLETVCEPPAAEITIVRAVSSVALGGRASDADVVALDARLRARHHDLARRTAVLRARSRFDRHPALALLEAAEEAEADLIVLGTRGAGGFPGLGVGGVATHVLHYARCPVALVPDAGH